MRLGFGYLSKFVKFCFFFFFQKAENKKSNKKIPDGQNFVIFFCFCSK